MPLAVLTKATALGSGRLGKLRACVPIGLAQVNYPMTVTSGSPVAHTVYNGATCAATPEPSQALGLVNVPTLTCGVGWLQAADPGHAEEP